MGNCLVLCKCNPSSGSCEIVRIAKQDGKILEFRSPICVKDILANFPANDIGVSENAATESLSQDYELQEGRLYYLLPPNSCSSSTNVTSIGHKEPESGIKRIKVLITKQQLQQLVAKQISLEDLLSDVKTVCVNLTSDRKPKLDSIPEEENE